jgi:hypothetical protein
MCEDFGGKTSKQEVIWRTGHSREGDIKKDLEEIGGRGAECICLEQGGDRWQAFVDTVMNTVSVRRRDSRNYLRDGQFHKKDFASWNYFSSDAPQISPTVGILA